MQLAEDVPLHCRSTVLKHSLGLLVAQVVLGLECTHRLTYKATD